MNQKKRENRFDLLKTAELKDLIKKIGLFGLLGRAESYNPLLQQRQPQSKHNKIKQSEKKQTLLSVSMISSIKYISPALLFNKTFLKSYQYVLSLLYLIQSV